MPEVTDFHFRILVFERLTQGKGTTKEFMFCFSWTAHRWLIIRNTSSKGNHGQLRFLRNSTIVPQWPLDNG